MIKGIICIIGFLILTHFWIAPSYADYRDPEVRTHVNEQTTYFKDTLESPEALMKDLAGSFDKTKESIGSSDQALSELSNVVGSGKDEVMDKSGQLSAINARDLEARGREELTRENVIDDLYVDYSKPLNQQHAKDAELLAEAQNGLFANLLGKLKELGVDCKVVKGDKVSELEYYMQINTTQHKDTLYNQTLCEELRNKYNCTDSLTLKCTQQGIRWHTAEDRYWEAGFDEINNLGFGDVFWGDYTGKRTFETKLRGLFSRKEKNKNVGLEARYKQLLATKLGVSPENILEVSAIGHKGGIYPSGRNKVYHWHTYYFHYKYHESYEVCEEWQETWTERCRLP